MNLTKEQALKKIEELKSYIEGLEKPFEVGNIYAYPKSGDITETVMVTYSDYTQKKFILTGCMNNLFLPFSKEPLTREEMTQFLNQYYRKIGKAKIVVEPV